MKKQLRTFDGAEYLDTPDAQAEFITAALETGDQAFVARAIGIVARARGMTAIAKEAGITREALYRSFSETGDPKLSTILGVIKALGLQVSVTAAPAAAA